MILYQFLLEDSRKERVNLINTLQSGFLEKFSLLPLKIFSLLPLKTRCSLGFDTIYPGKKLTCQTRASAKFPPSSSAVILRVILHQGKAKCPLNQSTLRQWVELKAKVLQRQSAIRSYTLISLGRLWFLKTKKPQHPKSRVSLLDLFKKTTASEVQGLPLRPGFALCQIVVCCLRTRWSQEDQSPAVALISGFSANKNQFQKASLHAA